MPKATRTDNIDADQTDTVYTDQEVATLAVWKETLDAIRYILEIRNRRTLSSEEIDQFILSLRNLHRDVHRYQAETLHITNVADAIADDIRRITTPLYVAADTLAGQNTPAGRARGFYTQLDDAYDQLVQAYEHIPVALPQNRDPTHFLEALTALEPMIKHAYRTLETITETFDDEPIWANQIMAAIEQVSTLKGQLAEERQRIDSTRHLIPLLADHHWQVAQLLHQLSVRVRDLDALIVVFDTISDSKTRTYHTSLTTIRQELRTAISESTRIQSLIQSTEAQIMRLTMAEGEEKS